MADKPLLEVKDLVIHYETDDGVVKALNGVNIHIGVGETLGLVGETGAGKTTLAKGIMRLIHNPPGKILGGEVIFEGQDLLKLSTNGMEAIRGRGHFHDIPGSYDLPEPGAHGRRADHGGNREPQHQPVQAGGQKMG